MSCIGIFMENDNSIKSSTYKKFIEDRVQFCLDTGRITSDMKERFFDSPGTSIALLMLISGMQTELAEITDIIQKKVFYGRKMNASHLMEELGDFLYYWDLFLHQLRHIYACDDINDIVIRLLNKQKLEIRYPDRKYSEHNSLNRDIEKEKSVFQDYDLEV